MVKMKPVVKPKEVKQKPKGEKGLKIKPKYIPLIVAAAIVIVSVVLFSHNAGILGNMILLAAVVAFMPWMILTYVEMQHLRAVEDQMPAFMLDLSETQKAGLTLTDALRLATRTDYGRLSPEIKRINNQISWGIPLPDALADFGKRLEKSEIIGRIVRIINEAYRSGGDISRTMEATAADIIVIKEAQKERKSVMTQHVTVMYAIYFIFIGIIVGLSKTLLPMLQMNVESAAVGGILAFVDPCGICVGAGQPISCISCNIFGVMCQMFDLGGGTTCYYRALFMLMAIMQGIFSGLVAGQIGEGRAIAGLKHSVIMTGVGFGIIILLLQIGYM